MYVADYNTTTTEPLSDTKRVWNDLFSRGMSADRDLDILVERGEPGAFFRAHSHDFEQWFFVIEGTVAITIDGEERILRPRSLVYVPRNAMHAGRNAGDGPIETLVIDHWPRDSEDRWGL